MRQYLVEVEVRKRGAIGEFNIKRYIINANTAIEARDRAFERAQMSGYETRAIGANEVPPCQTTS